MIMIKKAQLLNHYRYSEDLEPRKQSKTIIWFEALRFFKKGTGNKIILYGKMLISKIIL